jgi:hypothetical protein
MLGGAPAALASEFATYIFPFESSAMPLGWLSPVLLPAIDARGASSPPPLVIAVTVMLLLPLFATYTERTEANGDGVGVGAGDELGLGVGVGPDDEVGVGAGDGLGVATNPLDEGRTAMPSGWWNAVLLPMIDAIGVSLSVPLGFAA